MLLYQCLNIFDNFLFCKILILDRRGDSDEKDSSLDSGTETRHYSEMHRETKITSKQVSNNKELWFVIVVVGLLCR